MSSANLVSADVWEKYRAENDRVKAPASTEQPLTPLDFISLAGLLSEEGEQSVTPGSLHISLSETGHLQVAPEKLTFKATNNEIGLVHEGLNANEVHVFTRNASVVEIDRQRTAIRSSGAGNTEIYVTYRGNLHIVPVEVEEKTAPPIQVPETLTQLEREAHIETQEVAGYQVKPLPTNTYSLSGEKAHPTTLHVDSPEFSLEEQSQQYVATTVQLLDDRSSGLRNKLYPIGGAKIKVIGTDFLAQTDNRGEVTLSDIPKNAELIVRAFDDNGLLQPSIFIVHSNVKSRHIVMRRATFEIMQRMAGVTQNSFLSSICINVLGDEGYTSENTEVVLEAPADGPYYFNAFGIMDASLQSTGENGRACFFNVEPGSTAIHLYSGGEFLVTKAIATYAGAHSERDIENRYVAPKRPQTIVPAITASAHATLHADHNYFDSLKPLEWASIVPLGSSEELSYRSDAHLKTPEAIHESNGYIRLLSQASEFEEMILHLPLKIGRSTVAPLLPRGFLEDMAYYAQVELNTFDGHVLVDVGKYSDNESDGEIVLYDSDNQQVGQSFPFQSNTLVRTLFFNLKPGQYSVICKTAEGFWLHARTVVVYSSTVSYLSAGASLQWNGINPKESPNEHATVYAR